ncbi:hypothetical protein Q5P01_011097 [Channa striata]|uniref:Ig-like domain-containing protein n=1 Tax=Channa striata TaxID=64152 RepID=A0AA88ST39_CHASR|nr:hypothetical protein Q5P01_011097 [Channa striata]
MIYFFLLGLFFPSHSPVLDVNHLAMFALLGDSITLPCAIPSIRYCSSINWKMVEEFQTVTEVVKAGKVTVPDVHRLILLRDCSLEIKHLELSDARLYFCEIGNIRENPNAAEGKTELQCFLNDYKGHVVCNNTGLHIKWSTEDNTPLNGNRFHFANPSECFSKLIINKKPTDHRRKWKCQLTQNDVVKASISYTTTETDGVEEVFAAVGESVSLSCSNTSSLGIRSVKWTVGGRPLTNEILLEKGQTKAFHVNRDSSLLISKVSALHGADYQCSDSIHKVRLHVLDVISESGPEGDNITLTCMLICAKECDTGFDLTWCGGNQQSWQSGSMRVNNTVIKKLFLPVCPLSSDEITCSVHRENAVMASKKWRCVHSLLLLLWLVLPLGLLVCVATAGLYIYTKRKRDEDAGNEQSSIQMAHVYDAVQDVKNEEPQRRSCNREAAFATLSFYDLLQPVN